jgi:arabinose-5-phosphate isomerase
MTISFSSLFASCLEEEALAIAEAAKRTDPLQVDRAISFLIECGAKGGKLVVTGVGKSGIVSRKIAATFSSLGMHAIYLSPIDALHGDLGVVRNGDVALLLSNSGETDELLSLLPHLIRREVKCIALVGRKKSTLAKSCDAVLDAAVDREVCPLNLAPTASTALAMAIGDALAAVWTEQAGISEAEFAINHPAGALGRGLTCTAKDLMVPACEFSALHPNALLPEVITSLTRGSLNHGTLGAVWIHDKSDPCLMAGLITDGDLRRTLQCHDIGAWDQITAAEMATSNPITVTPEVLAVDALALMERNPRQAITVLPVVDPAQPQSLHGLLRLHDLVQAGFNSRIS